MIAEGQKKLEADKVEQMKQAREKKEQNLKET